MWPCRRSTSVAHILNQVHRGQNYLTKTFVIGVVSLECLQEAAGVKICNQNYLHMKCGQKQYAYTEA